MLLGNGPCRAAVEQRISLVTLGVDDLPRARQFYERLGWRGQQVQDTVFLQAGPLVLVLWGRADLAGDCGLPDTPRTGFDGIALAHNVHAPAEVDEVLRQAAAAGARITRPAATTFYGGYAGVFTDPDGHAWEVAHNPGFVLGDDGSLTVPDLGVPQSAATEGPGPV